MTRLIGHGPDQRLPSIGGRFVVARTAAGFVLRTMPRPRGRTVTAKQKASMDRFAQAVLAIKYMSQLDWYTARTQQKLFALLPRDWLMMCLFGRVGRVRTKSREVIWPMAGRKDTSTILDAIVKQPGSMMFRAHPYWVGIPPGNTGDILRYRTETTAPRWEPAPTPALNRSFYACRAPTAYTASRCFVGQLTQLGRDIEVTAVWQLVTAPIGTRYYRPVVGRIRNSGSFDVTQIQIGPEAEFYTAFAGTFWRRAVFAAPVSIPADPLFFAGLMRTDGGGTTTIDTRYNSEDWQQLPGVGVSNGNAASFNTLTPTVGTVPTFPSGTFPIGLEYT